MIYLTAIGFTPGGSSIVNIYTQTIRRTSGVPRNFVRDGGGCQQIQLRTERTGIRGAVAP